MLRVTLFLLFVMSSNALMAATVTVLSGEHDSFTRLTFSMPSDATYAVSAEGKAIRVAFSGDDPLRIDSSRLFDRISRDRISEARTFAPAGFEINLGCDCTYSDFFQEPNLLVIDVREARDSDTPEKNEASAVEKLGRSLVLPLRDGFTTEGTKDIAQAISRNITRGVLEKSRLGSGTEPEPTGQDYAGVDFPAANMSLSPIPGAAKPDPSTDKICFAIAVAPLPADLGAEAYHARAGALTARLFRESGSVNTSVALDLARIQLAFGLATEALATLRLADGVAEDVAYLREFASVLAERPDGQHGRLHAYRKCSALALLAATLSDEGNRIDPDDVPNLLIAMEEVSRPLLKSVGPRLTAALAASDLTDAAAQSLRIRTRALPEDPLRLADLELASDATKKDDAVRDIAGSNDLEAVDAAVSLVASATQSKQPLSAEDAALVSSLAFENRKTSAAETIAKAEIYALATRGQFDEAFEKFDQTDLPPRVRSEALAYLVSELARTGSDIAFLKHAVKRLEDIANAQSAEDVALRLYESGFGSLADGLLARLGSPSDDVLHGMVRHAATRGDLTDVPPDLVERAQTLDDPQAVYRLALLQDDFDLAVRLAPANSPGESLRLMMNLGDAEDPMSVAPETPEASLQASHKLAEAARSMTSRIETALGFERQTPRSDN